MTSNPRVSSSSLDTVHWTYSGPLYMYNWDVNLETWKAALSISLFSHSLCFSALCLSSYTSSQTWNTGGTNNILMSACRVAGTCESCREVIMRLCEGCFQNQARVTISCFTLVLICIFPSPFLCPTCSPQSLKPSFAFLFPYRTSSYWSHRNELLRLTALNHLGPQLTII